jgi:hypothetical protein
MGYKKILLIRPFMRKMAWNIRRTFTIKPKRNKKYISNKIDPSYEEIKLRAERYKEDKKPIYPKIIRTIFIITAILLVSIAIQTK